MGGFFGHFWGHFWLKMGQKDHLGLAVCPRADCEVQMGFLAIFGSKMGKNGPIFGVKFGRKVKFWPNLAGQNLAKFGIFSRQIKNLARIKKGRPFLGAPKIFS